jgi:hypothetical protein
MPPVALAPSRRLRLGLVLAGLALRMRSAWRHGGALAAALVGLAFVAALAGLAERVPGAVRLAGLAALLLAVAVLVARARLAPAPSAADMLAWLERRASLPRGALRPLLGSAVTAPSPLAEALWQREQARASAIRPRIARRPLLRAAAVSALLVALAAGGTALAPERLARALSPWPHDLRPLRLAVLVEPPGWSGRPAQRVALEPGTTAELRLLRGSRVSIAAEGVDAPWRLNGSAVLARQVEAPERLRLHIGPRTVARLSVMLLPDRPPLIAWAAPPRATPAGALALAWRLDDDHGGVELGLELAQGAQRERLWQPGRWSAGDGQRLVDLARHPWAGREAMVRLLARDGAGQVAVSDPQPVRLPERVFSHPVAREVVAARARLLDNPATRLDVAQRLLEIASEPERLGEALTPFAGLSAAARRLAASDSAESLASAADLMWEVAVALDGGADAAAERLARALAGLEEALAGAGGDQAIREALAELGRAAEEAGRAAAAAGAARPMRAQELEAARALAAELADRLAAGDREGARAMIAALRRALEEARAAAAGAGGMAAAEALARAQAARDLAQRQRALARRTGETGQAGLPGLAAPQGALAQEAGRAGAPQAAAGAMETARAALARGDRASAEAAQRAAAQALEQAAQALEEQAAAALPAVGRDPLGRPGAGSGAGDLRLADPDRARRLEEIRALLRERAADPARPPEERAYYLRLLRRF